jgi:hypothetical protein
MQYPICKKNLLCNLVSSSSVLNRLTSPLLAVLSGTGPVSLHTPPLVSPILLSQSVLCVITFFITLFSPEHAIRTGNLNAAPSPKENDTTPDREKSQIYFKLIDSSNKRLVLASLLGMCFYCLGFFVSLSSCNI